MRELRAVGRRDRGGEGGGGGGGGGEGGGEGGGKQLCLEFMIIPNTAVSLLLYVCVRVTNGLLVCVEDESKNNTKSLCAFQT